VVRCVLPVAITAVALCAGCGSSGEGAKEASITDVKLGMTQRQVTRMLGQPDEKHKLYGLPEAWVEWLWDTGDGTWSVTFSKGGRVTKVLDCPQAMMCTVVASKD
jgi:hypothetical protein